MRPTGLISILVSIGVTEKAIVFGAASSFLDIAGTR